MPARNDNIEETAACRECAARKAEAAPRGLRLEIEQGQVQASWPLGAGGSADLRDALLDVPSHESRQTDIRLAARTLMLTGFATIQTVLGEVGLDFDTGPEHTNCGAYGCEPGDFVTEDGERVPHEHVGVHAHWGGVAGVRMLCTPRRVVEEDVCRAIVEALEDLARELEQEIPRHDPILTRDFGVGAAS
jgi:hypothetical protein